VTKVIAFPQKPDWEEMLDTHINQELFHFPASTREAIRSATKKHLLKYSEMESRIDIAVRGSFFPDEVERVRSALEKTRDEITEGYHGILMEMFGELVGLKIALCLRDFPPD